MQEVVVKSATPSEEDTKKAKGEATNDKTEKTKTSGGGEEDPKKRNGRKRKRHFYNAIRAQMEFYFGDANLRKDRFMRKLIDEDPFVPLEVFLTFNKLKLLTASVENIVQALSNSELLEVDDSGLKVRRKTALPTERNVDERTLYVEALPPTADHDWVRQVFERFGPVAYVSLPKYAKSRKIKEFGFVEFESAKSVRKTVKAFQAFNGVLSIEQTDPSHLTSVKSYIIEQNSAEPDEKTTEEAEKKRSLPEEMQEEPPSKRPKIEVEAPVPPVAVVIAQSSDDEATATELDAGGEESDAKSRRRKKKHQRTMETLQKKLDLNANAAYHELKILPKMEWKRLRNNYLNLQRKRVAELKREAWQERQNVARENAATGSESLGDITNSPPATASAKPSDGNLRKMNMNFYGAGGEEEVPPPPAQPQPKAASKEGATSNPALERAPLFQYEAGLIVEITFIEPCVNVKEFKADMRQYSSVKYIDVKEGAMHAHLRIESPTAAEEFVGQLNCAEYKCKILAGEAEVEYWKKIEKDREMKLNKQVKVPQKRGREKVKKLISKHIRFGDENGD